MESFRLKNIIILILALMNLCLLGLLGVRLTTGYSAQAEARQQMVQLFAAEGVSLDDGIIPGATPDEDEKLAGFLLGDELVMSDGGGGVTTYQSENGSAVFRSDGTFDVVIEQSGETADALCRAFCRAFHYEALAFSLDGEDGSASAVQTYDGAPVVNCTVSFSISGGRVASVSGTHLPQAGQTANGNGALSALDALLPHLRRDRTWQDASWRQTTLLMTAITLHNVPEGMAVGLAFALVSGGEGFAGAAALAMGIGIQNFPEGAAVALPLRQGGWSRPRAFVGGMLSGAVEPVFGVLAALAAAGVDPLMPWLLSFAAGAMLYVVVEELIPQAHSRAGTCGFVMGFLVMMVLDVALGG